MGDSEEHGQSDRRRMEQCHHPGFPVGVPLGGSDVRCRHADPLVADQLEETVSARFQRYAALADGHRCLHCHRRHLPVCFRRNATVHIFSILKIC